MAWARLPVPVLKEEGEYVAKLGLLAGSVEEAADVITRTYVQQHTDAYRRWYWKWCANRKLAREMAGSRKLWVGEGFQMES